MANEKNDPPVAPIEIGREQGVLTDEKIPAGTNYEELHRLDSEEQALESHLNVTEDDLIEAKAVAANLSLEGVRTMMQTVIKIHDRDPNFPHGVLMKIHEFLDNESIFENPEKHEEIIWEMKLEAALITNNSPYAEVRAVVDNKDDPSMPCGTIRAWTIGVLFSVFLAFINQLFSVRQPLISIESNVAQLLAFPVGKAWEKFMPNVMIPVGFGVKLPLNPGRFNKKEHMLIAIMANTAKSLPYTQYIVWTQVLPQYFNQPYAKSFAYQILIALSTNFIGYGLAGLTRRFIVYPSYCVWPASLVTIALNSALHNETNTAVPGPFKKLYSMTRYKFFLWSFGAMFIYFWFPNYIFEVLTFFSWMTWISPSNHNLEILTGFRNGLGMFNPWPTFDWNVMLFDSVDPLMVPAFSTFNRTLGMWLLGFVIMGIYFTNAWNTAYIPINSNRVYDHFGKLYNVSRALDDRGMYDHEKYMDYSAAYLGAANTLVYGSFFALYSAAITHVAIFHRYEIMMGFKNLWNTIRRKKNTSEDGTQEGEYKDIHNRLMSKYPEVSEWWYLGTLIVAAGFGFAGVAGWPTYTTPGVVPYGVFLAVIFVIPIGIIKAMTGIEVTLNVLAEFIGGMWVEGNALAMNFFKSFGYVTCAHAVHFANDLKVAHYLKIPPRQTFACQMVATLISTFICTAVINFQISIPNICTPDAPMRLFCPGPNTFFTAAVLWGTIGPLKVFGHQGQYNYLLLGFPVGIALPIIFYYCIKWAPKNRYLRQFHPVALFYGGVNWAPYSFSYAWPAVPIAWLSWIYVRNRYLAFWSKYNFVLSASFSAGIAIAGILMLFTVQWVGAEVPWWGTEQIAAGCEGKACTLKTLAPGERFYPWWNPSQVPAP
ncbi:opt oligopeptide transporter [Colletotrichum truncatum]|uniref:Opt oligopeptide transporter n=1 Tax=Colletotrichum truncatum TaxID=5467 RepID=A0ACC3Z2K0_COLTU|nr:opt oligopeptide transporter [Colletotrichum truncatum]KAF6782696.1 opt oligopeptide transporter [Colletotrichum truncatum]